MPFQRERLARKRSKSKLNRLFSELRYYRELHSETKDLFLEYDLELNLVLEDITSIIDPNSKTLKSLEEPEETAIALTEPDAKPEEGSQDQEKSFSSEEVSEKSAIPSIENESSLKAPKWMKVLFKKIAIETHPDKIQSRSDLSDFEKNERSVLYKKAAAAIENLEKIKLIEVGYALEIQPDICESEQKIIIIQAIDTEKNEINKTHQLVSWVWGENFGNIETRSRLLVYVRKQLGLPEVSIDIIEKYVTAFENDEDLSLFKEKYLNKKINKNKKIYRKVGERPAPSFSKSRK